MKRGVFLKQYFMPTKIFSGRGSVLENREALASLGNCALIVTGAQSAVKSGALSDVTEALKKNGQGYVLYDKVMQNPTIACVYEGAEVAKTNKADFVIAIGGGSPMDAAKVMAILACQEIAEENLFSGKYEKNVLPVVAIPTTSGTGSEVTPYAVLTNDRLQTKTSVATPLIFPVFAFLDGAYTDGLSQSITVDTAIDALSHAVEGYLSIKAGDVTDSLAESSMRYTGQIWKSLKSGKYTAEDRDALMMASTLAGMVIANTGTTMVHAMGYPLTYFHQIPHGRANALLMGKYLAFMEKGCPEKVQKVLSCLGFSTVNEFSKEVDFLLGEKENLSTENLRNYAERVSKLPQIKNGLSVPSLEILQEIYIEGLR